MPLMTPEQNAAFNSANTGQSFVAVDVGTLFVGAAIAMLMLWVSWVALASYRALGKPGVTAADAAGKVMRALFVLIIAISVMTLS